MAYQIGYQSQFQDLKQESEKEILDLDVPLEQNTCTA